MASAGFVGSKEAILTWGLGDGWVCSEFHGFGMYFMSYEALVAHHQKANGIRRDQIPVPMAAAYGALAGWAMWLTVSSPTLSHNQL